MWDYMKPYWNRTPRMRLEWKINALNVSRIELGKTESNPVKNRESNQIVNDESNQVGTRESNQVGTGESNQPGTGESNQDINSESNKYAWRVMWYFFALWVLCKFNNWVTQMFNITIPTTYGRVLIWKIPGILLIEIILALALQCMKCTYRGIMIHVPCLCLYLSGHNNTHAMFMLVTDPTAHYSDWVVITPVTHSTVSYTIYWLIYRDHLWPRTQRRPEQVELIELMGEPFFGISQLKLPYISSKTLLRLPPSRETVHQTQAANNGPKTTDLKRLYQRWTDTDQFKTTPPTTGHNW